MTNKLLETLWRADRVLASAVALVALAAGGIAGAAIVHPPHTNKSAVVAQIAKAPAPESNTAQILESDPALAQLVSEHKCLSEALYYEARGEGAKGQMAVAEVIFHRLHNKHYPSTICGVVYQGQETKDGCQFSFACEKHAAAKEENEWDSAQMLAARILTGGARMNDVTDEATHFHTISSSPEWADHLVKTIQIGNHVFYRDAPLTRRS
jgi:spore germination cell wall hydrolase CwlJ-like protein